MAIDKFLFEKLYTILTLLTMGLFCSSWIGRTKKAPIPKICLTYPTMMALVIVIPNRKKIQKIYKSRDTLLEFCSYQYFFTENQQILLHQEIQM